MLKGLLNTVAGTLLSAAVSLSTPAFGAAEITGSVDEVRAIVHPAENVVTISGFAEEKAYSDRAVINLVVTTEDKRLSGSMEKNSALREGLVKTLAAAGIAAADIQSSKFSSSPQYGLFGKKPASYQVVNRLTVTIRREDQLKSVAAAADKFPEVTLADMAFEHSEKDQYTARVKAAALDKIMADKQTYEKRLGVKLKAVGVRDIRLEQYGSRSGDIVEEVIVTGIRASGGRSDRDSYEPDFTPEPTFDAVKYQAHLQVEFKFVE